MCLHKRKALSFFQSEDHNFAHPIPAFGLRPKSIIPAGLMAGCDSTMERLSVSSKADIAILLIQILQTGCDPNHASPPGSSQAGTAHTLFHSSDTAGMFPALARLRSQGRARHSPGSCPRSPREAAHRWPPEQSCKPGSCPNLLSPNIHGGPPNGAPSKLGVWRRSIMRSVA